MFGVGAKGSKPMLGRCSPLSHTPPALFLFYFLHFIYYVSCVQVSECSPQHAQVELTRQPAEADFLVPPQSLGDQTQVLVIPDPDSGAPWEDFRGLKPLGNLFAVSYSSDSQVDCLVESGGWGTAA